MVAEGEAHHSCSAIAYASFAHDGAYVSKEKPIFQRVFGLSTGPMDLTRNHRVIMLCLMAWAWKDLKIRAVEQKMNFLV